MKVIYEYDEETKRIIKAIDDAIDFYYEEFRKEFFNTHRGIIKPDDMHSLNRAFNRDPMYEQLKNHKMRIINSSFPKTIIIETDDKTMEFPITK